MSTENAKESAFPIAWTEDQHIQGGLTKREYFAAMAMQGLLSNTGYVERLKPESYDANKLLVMEAIDMADALLHQLNQTP